MNIEAQLKDFNNSTPVPPQPPSVPKSTAQRAAEREIQVLKMKVSSMRKQRETFSKEVVELEKQLEMVGAVSSLFTVYI